MGISIHLEARFAHLTYEIECFIRSFITPLPSSSVLRFSSIFSTRNIISLRLSKKKKKLANLNFPAPRDIINFRAESKQIVRQK